MKSNYLRYGRRAEELERNLTKQDRQLLEEFLQFCAIGAGAGQISKHRRNLLHFRDVVEKPFDSITKQDAIVFWAEKLRDKAILILLYETAGRPQEIRELRWGGVNWDEEEVHLYSTKTEDDRDLPLNESLQHLRRWYDEWV